MSTVFYDKEMIKSLKINVDIKILIYSKETMTDLHDKWNITNFDIIYIYYCFQHPSARHHTRWFIRTQNCGYIANDLYNNTQWTGRRRVLFYDD